jgi:four helix bundle protein
MQKTTNLAVAGRARTLAHGIYRATSVFPAVERYGLAAQMRRAAVSIGSNIAEGCGRQGDRALIACLQIALGSASELEFQLALATDLGLIPTAAARALSAELHQLMRMLRRLIGALRRSTVNRGARDTAHLPDHPQASRPSSRKSTVVG